MKDFRKLNVWQKSHTLTLEVYRVTLRFPKEELYNLTSQMRSSAASIPTNIAEGTGRSSSADFGRFLSIAYGSSSELDYQLLLSKDLGYLPVELYQKLYSELGEIQKMLHRLIQKIRIDRIDS